MRYTAYTYILSYERCFCQRGVVEKPVKDIRLIAIDIDGTLLTPDGQITPRTRTAIEAAQRAGIIVTLATARRYFSTGAIATELGLELPLIVYDGALIVNHPARTVLYSRALAAGVAQQVVDVFRQFAVQPVVQPCDCMQEEVWTGPAEYDHLELATYITLAKGRLRRLPYAQLCAGQADPLRVVAFASEECIQRLLPAVSDPACSKASGVAALASYYNIPLEQVMAIGDNTNDREMLRSAGWSVAMGQASEEVKAAAKAVTGTNLEDGVAQAIERYALLQDFQPVRSRSDSSV